MIKIPIYIINLKKDKKKKKYMQKLCVQHNITVEFFEAIEGDVLENSYINRVYSKSLSIQYFGRELTKGEIGTALSHLSIYKKILKEDIERVLVLEDDVECYLENNEIHDIINQIPIDCECLLLGAHPSYSSKIDGASSFWAKKTLNSRLAYVRYSEKVFGAYGYIINKNGAKKLLESFIKINRPIDHWDDCIINLYGITPSVVIPNQQLLNFSSLEKDRNKQVVQRTFIQKVKDFIRMLLEYIKVIKYILRIKSFISKFGKLKKYEK